MDEQALKDFQTALDENYSWPCIYVFKFIVPRAQLDALMDMFKGYAVRTRESKNARYISLTVEMEMQTSEEVISVYREAAKIEGIISL